MKNRLRVLQVLFFILLLTLPMQVFADEKGGKHTHADEKKTEAKKETDDDHGHDEDDDHGHGEDETRGHDEADDHGHGEGDDHGDGDDHGHGEGDDHGDGDDHGHGEDDDHGDGDDHGHGEGDDHGDDDHDHEYVETGANIPLLSTFAAINGGFILFGAVRKINKKRKSGVK